MSSLRHPITVVHPPEAKIYLKTQHKNVHLHYIKSQKKIDVPNMHGIPIEYIYLDIHQRTYLYYTIHAHGPRKSRRIRVLTTKLKLTYFFVQVKFK